MKAHIRVSVEAGLRTEISVEAYCTSVNPKTFEFANGETVTDEQIATWIERELTRAMKKLAGESNDEN